MGTWKSKNRHKYLLQYHIISVCKYRKKLLIPKRISDGIKQFPYEICQKHNVIMKYMETDKGHIHYMPETEPTMSVSKIVNLMKSYTTYHIWERYPNYLQKHLAVAVLFITRHLHTEKKNTGIVKNPLLKQTVIITAIGNERKSMDGWKKWTNLP